LPDRPQRAFANIREKISALREIVSAQAQMKDFAEAKQTAEKIDDVYYRAMLQIDIAPPRRRPEM